MSRCTLWIRDAADGSVETTSLPPVDDLMKKVQRYGAASLTPAETYLLGATHAMREMSRAAEQEDRGLIVRIPRLGT